MMKNNKNFKSGFSLLESIISMLLLSIVILTSLAVITRRKPDTTSSKLLAGTYVCYMQSDLNGNAQLTELTYIGNTIQKRVVHAPKGNGEYVKRIQTNNFSSNEITNYIEGDTYESSYKGKPQCEFIPDRRTRGRLFKIIVGARTNRIDAQAIASTVSVNNGNNDKYIYSLGTKDSTEAAGRTLLITKQNLSNQLTTKTEALGGFSVQLTSNNKKDPIINSDYNVEQNGCKSIENGETCSAGPDSSQDNRMMMNINGLSSTPTECKLISTTKKQYKCGETEKKVSIMPFDAGLKFEANEKLSNSPFIKQLKLIPEKNQTAIVKTIIKLYSTDAPTNYTNIDTSSGMRLRSSNENSRDGMVVIFW